MLRGKLLKETPAWGAPQAHYETIKDIHLRQLFAQDTSRDARFAAEGAGLYLDFSKNRITDETVRLLVQLARERGVAERRDAIPELESKAEPNLEHDSSTNSLIRRYRGLKETSR